jgi:hypothetical protein
MRATYIPLNTGDSSSREEAVEVEVDIRKDSSRDDRA